MTLKSLYRKSRWLHKVFGLILIPFLIWMSISGIILNHPHWTAQINVPAWLIPGHYDISNWNRSSIIGAVQRKDGTLFLYGKKGVWQVKKEDSVKYLGQGFPHAAMYKKTNHLILLPQGHDSLLIAATDGGLYFAHLQNMVWKKVELPGPSEKLKKILSIGKRLLVIGESNFYQGQFSTDHSLSFQKVTPDRFEQERKVTLVQLFFDLHDGKVWGLWGRLLMDLMGIIIIFASVTGFYVWFWPWRTKKVRKIQFKPKAINRLRNWNKWHIKVGAVVAVFFLILAGTGLFMRPPFLVAIAEKSVEAKYYPGKLSPNPWEHKILNALYDAQRQRLVIAASDGLWAGDIKLNKPFRKIELNVPIFVMGPTHFEALPNGHYRVASFNGIFDYDPDKNQAINLLTGRKAEKVSSVRPADIMVTGFFETKDGSQWITAHEQGICNMQGKQVQLWPVPKSMNDQHTISLWNYMFEMHNGRLFKFILGNFYILIIPLGSIGFLLITFCGLFDWAYRKFRKPVAVKEEISRKLFIGQPSVEV